MKKNITLTDSQKKALEIKNNIIVEAGAGSGKTTILVQRYLKILENNPESGPENILALTFTRKAAGEMLHRIQNEIIGYENISKNRRLEISGSLYKAKISTIHSFCQNIIKKHPVECHIDPSFEIIEAEEGIFLFNRIIEDTIKDLQLEKSRNLEHFLINYGSKSLRSVLLSLFNQREAAQYWLNHYLYSSNSDILSDLSCSIPEEMNTIQEELELLKSLLIIYQNCENRLEQVKRETGKLDYIDLLIMARDLLTKNDHIRKSLQDQFPFIMVDEFQDTDYLQWEIIRLTGGLDKPVKQNNIFIVGDIKQSIYGFRGAVPELFEEIKSNTDQKINALLISLNDNFRSQSKLIDFINPLFENIFQSTGKFGYTPLIANKADESSSIEFAVFEQDNCVDFMLEANFISKWIRSKLNELPNLKLSDFAILIRRKKHMTKLKEVLNRFGLEAFIHTGKSINKKEEIIDLFCLIKGLLDPYDNLAWIRVLKSPLSGISDDAVFLLYNFFNAPEFLTKIYEFAKQSDNKLESLGFDKLDINLMKEAAKSIPLWLESVNFIALPELIETILLETKAWALYASGPEGFQKTKTIKTFLKKIELLTKNAFSSNPDLIRILEDSIFNANNNISDPEPITPNAINILSIHASKGLEFPVVILPECGKSFNLASNSKLIISRKYGLGLYYRSNQNKYENKLRNKIKQQIEDDTINEEKRLFYVSCTRAKDHLLISGSKKSTSKQNNKTYLDFILPFSVLNTKEKRILFTFPSTDQSSSITQNYKLYSSPEDIKTDPHTTLAPLIPASIKPENKKNVLNTKLTLSKTCNLPVSLSTTQACTLLKCPKKYRYYPLLNKLQSLDMKMLPSIKLSHLTSAKDIGTTVHNIIQKMNTEKISFKNKDRLEQYIKKDLCLPVTKSTVNTVFAHIKNFICSNIFHDINSGLESIHEKPFSLKIEELIIEGRFDTVYKKNNSWQIIDYKTDNISPGEIESHSLYYKNQLAIYFIALKTLYDLNQTHYEAKLYFTRLGKEKAVFFTNDDLVQVQTKLGDLYSMLIKNSFPKTPAAICEECLLYQQSICKNQ
ncbi:MAG: UvrD-helicase domain-containing protein [bacterium]|nr:UvrD-helicase domain-containing protein [bacterium]